MVYKQKFVAVIKVNGRVLREQNVSNGSGEVFIPFGCEYEIELKNLHTTQAHVTIEIDGRNILDDRMLLIGPNSSKTIERFVINGNLNNGPRLKFIEKTEQISQHRGDYVEDGIVRISYQFELPKRPRINPLRTEIHHFHHHGYLGFQTSEYGTQPRSIIPDNCTVDSAYSSEASYCANTEGITSYGQESSQSFTEVCCDAQLESEVHSIVLKLHGTKDDTYVSQPVTTKRKITCSVCGNKNKSDMKFCGECGTNLEY